MKVEKSCLRVAVSNTSNALPVSGASAVSDTSNRLAMSVDDERESK